LSKLVLCSGDALTQLVDIFEPLHQINVTLFSEHELTFTLAKVPNGIETLPAISIAGVGRTNVTDRWTGDDI